MDDSQAKPQGEETPKPVSFWKTLPGILTGIAAIVTAVATLLAAADKAGFFPGSSAPTQAGSSQGGVETSGDGSPVVQGTDGNVTITVGE